MAHRVSPRWSMAFLLVAAGSANAWGPDGHHTVAALAEAMIEGTHAQARVHDLLGGMSLQDAAVWADCAKGVDPARDYKYVSAGRYPECAVHETPEGEAAMIDYVRRNDTNCGRAPKDSPCHAQYHYADEALQRQRYRRGDVGTRDSDVVAALVAAIAVLRERPAPPPFDIKDQREALLLLAHFVGDVHQPLHVGAVYLDPQGSRVDPDRGAFDPATRTSGGNAIVTVDRATKSTRRQPARRMGRDPPGAGPRTRGLSLDRAGSPGAANARGRRGLACRLGDLDDAPRAGRLRRIAPGFIAGDAMDDVAHLHLRSAHDAHEEGGPY